jgi:hypothetical protein
VRIVCTSELEQLSIKPLSKVSNDFRVSMEDSGGLEGLRTMAGGLDGLKRRFSFNSGSSLPTECW